MSINAFRNAWVKIMICFLIVFSVTGCGAGLTELVFTGGSSSGNSTFAVANYGAKGDGVADDGPAIERAITAAAAAGGGQVVFPCGQFSVQSVNGSAPGARSLLYAKNAASVQLTGQGHCSHVFTTMPQKSVFEFEDSTSITINNLYITALNAPYVETYGMDGGSAIRFSGVSHGTISNIEVDGATAGALYLTKGTSSSTVSNNNVHDTYGSAIWEDDCGAASATSCAPSMPPVNNVYQSNTLTNTSLAMGSAIVLDDGNGVSNAQVHDNTISWNVAPLAGNTGPGVHCIQVNNASNVKVLTNSCSGTPWDGIVITTGAAGKSSGVTIQGNTIQNTGRASSGGSGIVVYDAPQGLGISGFTIASNIINTAADDGIRLVAASTPGNVQQGVIQKNTIQMVDQRSPGSRFGVDVEFSASITATSNSISCNGKCIAVGVRVNGSLTTTPSPTSNQVTNIVGVPLLIQQ